MLRQCMWIALLTAIFTTSEASIIKRNPKKNVTTEYQELTCTDQDRTTIYEIISTIGEKGKLSLLVQRSYLRELGSSITHVHPLKFLGVIFSDNYLKSCMSHVWNDYFKRTSFMEDLGPSLSREADKGKLDVFLADFSKEVGADPQKVKAYFDARDWDNFVIFLIYNE